MRINLDSQWFGDERWRYVAVILQYDDAFSIRARIENVWHYAYCQRRESLSAKEIAVQSAWPKGEAFAKAMVEADLADIDHDGLYRLRGVAKRIEFLTKQSERGKAGAEARANKRTLSERLANAKQTPSECQADAERVLSLPPSPALAPDQVLTPTHKKGGANAPVVAKSRRTPKVEGVQSFIGSFVDQYEASFGAKPIITGPEAKAAESIVKTMGLEKATACLEAYLGINDKWFAEKGYDLRTMYANLTRISTTKAKRANIETAYEPIQDREADFEEWFKDNPGRWEDQRKVFFKEKTPDQTDQGLQANH